LQEPNFVTTTLYSAETYFLYVIYFIWCHSEWKHDSFDFVIFGLELLLVDLKFIPVLEIVDLF
jgi:hypothetical protein